MSVAKDGHGLKQTLVHVVAAHAVMVVALLLTEVIWEEVKLLRHTKKLN